VRRARRPWENVEACVASSWQSQEASGRDLFHVLSGGRVADYSDARVHGLMPDLEEWTMGERHGGIPT
jgi:hypothetical protein